MTSNGAVDLSTVQAAIATYVSAGYALLPCLPKGKTPYISLLPSANGRHEWKTLAASRATVSEAQAWLAHNAGINLGIICGLASGGIVVLDVDDPAFAYFLRSSALALLHQTWTVETGSGKLHVYIRAIAQNRVLSSASGQKLGELRSDGWYVIAPPGVHPTGGSYQTLFGDPLHLLTIRNVDTLVDALIGRFLGQPSNPIAPSPPSPSDMTIKRGKYTSADAGDIKEKLRARNVPITTRTAIFKGATPGSPDWHRAGSNSEIDFGVHKDLIRARYSPDEIEDFYASFPIGGPTYRDLSRPHHGRSYLEQTYQAAAADLSMMEEKRSILAGENFQITDVVCVDGEPKIWKMLIVNFDTPTKETEFVRLDDDDFRSELAFSMAVQKQTVRLIPRMTSVYMGPKFRNFARNVALSATIEPVPDSARTSGLLIEIISRVLKGPKIDPDLPQKPTDFTVGYVDPALDAVFFRPGRLHQEMSMTLRNPPTTGAIYEVIKSLGGMARNVVVGGAILEMWVVQRSKLKD